MTVLLSDLRPVQSAVQPAQRKVPVQTARPCPQPQRGWLSSIFGGIFKPTGPVKARKIKRPLDARISIRSGEGGTEDTIRQMGRFAMLGSRDPIVRIWTKRVIRGIPGRDHEAVAKRIFHWMQDRGSGEKSGTKFINDAFRTEQVRAPWWVICVEGAGDCNSAFATTIAAMLLSVGIPCFFRTVKADPGRKHLYSHVYCVANIRGTPLALDASVPFSTPGSEPQVIYGHRDWPIEYLEQDDWGRYVA